MNDSKVQNSILCHFADIKFYKTAILIVIILISVAVCLILGRYAPYNKVSLAV